MAEKTETTTKETEQAETSQESCERLFTLSQLRKLLPPDETLVEFERHIIRSQIELLRGVRTLVDSYVSRLERREKQEQPKRVSKIEIKE
ncbi:MAG: hypothetical protein HY710_12140 [Candidatus Latescibacteria bacterium]|nr:hypothetical protein [Candidatus Latescibacterota bacterium]